MADRPLTNDFLIGDYISQAMEAFTPFGVEGCYPVSMDEPVQRAIASGLREYATTSALDNASRDRWAGCAACRRPRSGSHEPSHRHGLVGCTAIRSG